MYFTDQQTMMILSFAFGVLLTLVVGYIVTHLGSQHGHQRTVLVMSAFLVLGLGAYLADRAGFVSFDGGAAYAGSREHHEVLRNQGTQPTDGVVPVRKHHRKGKVV